VCEGLAGCTAVSEILSTCTHLSIRSVRYTSLASSSLWVVTSEMMGVWGELHHPMTDLSTTYCMCIQQQHLHPWYIPHHLLHVCLDRFEDVHGGLMLLRGEDERRR
jgi:hypothetical protein